MKIGIIQYPGSNSYKNFLCSIANFSDIEIIPIWYNDNYISSKDINLLIIPGGVSFGNLIRPGAIAKIMPITSAILEFSRQGGFILGIDNGFHILCEIGILPGTFLVNNNSLPFTDFSYLKVINNTSVFTGAYEVAKPIKITLSNCYSRYFIDESMLERLYEKGQIAFLYSDSKLNIDKKFDHTGSVANIAGILNGEKNVLGMMPHPERSLFASSPYQSGKFLFEGLFNCLMV